MYADHHVLAVRDALAAIPGVEDISASSARRRVSLDYDPKKVDEESIRAKLAEAGYAEGQELEYAIPPEGKEDSSAWFCVNQRVTTTNRLDLEMSGDFRKY